MNYQKFYQPKWVVKKTIKIFGKKRYQEFIKLIILICIILSLVTLFQSIGNIFAIFNSNISNIFLNISNTFYYNISSILFICIIVIFLKKNMFL